MAEKYGGNIRKEQAEATKRRLIDEAQKAFSENGYKGTSVRSLSKSLGISESLLYHYFPDGKKELLCQVLDEERHSVTENLSALENDSQMYSLPIEEAMERLFTLLSDTVAGHIDIIRIIVRESEVREFLSKDDISSLASSFSSWIEDLLQKRIDAGEIKNIDCKTTALTIKALLVNHIFVRILDLDSQWIDIPERRRKMINYYVSLWK